mmetsp:Transcript_6392/g.22497  ORF Transcript_6392/g.22497 Transcript_6392/m.22497 type:complete len:708 (-) Transcript_6392:16-2139(-)
MFAASGAAALALHRELLGRLSGTAPHAEDDPFWARLLSFPSPLSSIAPVEVEETLRGTCEALLRNWGATGHVRVLVLRLARGLRGVAEAGSGGAAAEAHVEASAAHLLRAVLKHAVERGLGGALGPDPEALVAFAGGEEAVSELLGAALALLGTPAGDATYVLHLEVTQLLLVLSATQLVTPLPAAGAEGRSHPFLERLCSQHAACAPGATRGLLTAYLEQKPPPRGAPLHQAAGRPSAAAEAAPQPSLIRRAAGGVFGLPMSAYRAVFSGAQPAGSPLADAALLLLLVLVNHNPAGSGAGGEQRAGPAPPDANPFRAALRTCRDTAYDVKTADPEGGGASSRVIRVPFSRLFSALGRCLQDDRSTLLLYSLVHGNATFLEYVLARSDLDTLLAPLLEMLYHAPERRPNQIYMLLIILLILSQDASFNANIHKLELPSVPWYRERLVNNISLGSLLVVVLIRTVKYNLSKLRDVYLHTNCLAALANMAPHMQSLNAYASQRLISLFDMLSRKYTKLSQTMPSEAPGAEPMEAPTELHVYTDFLRIVMEIINSVLAYALHKNPEVVYALLHRQELFTPFQSHPRFSELLDNIQAVLDYFNRAMDNAKVDGTWSVAKVMDVVETSARGWHGEGIKYFTELRFTYEEELHPEEFFQPYVWSLVCTNSCIPWDPDAVRLLTLNGQGGGDELEEDPGSPVAGASLDALDSAV